MFFSAALAAASFIGVATLSAQATPSGGSSVVGKGGLLNVRQAIIAPSEGKQASAELQGQFASRQTELENMNKQINDIRQRLQAGEGKLGPEEAALSDRE